MEWSGPEMERGAAGPSNIYTRAALVDIEQTAAIILPDENSHIPLRGVSV